MHFDIITCLPKLLESPFSDSILKRAQKKGLVSVNIIDLRSYSTDKHKSIDDYAFGGGAGMVMMIEPIDRCLEDLKSKRTYDDIIYMSPDGTLLTQSLANEISLKKNLILLCGHYKGVDERVRDEHSDGIEHVGAMLAVRHHQQILAAHEATSCSGPIQHCVLTRPQTGGLPRRPAPVR